MRGMKAARESKSASGFERTRAVSTLQSDASCWISRTPETDRR